MTEELRTKRVESDERGILHLYDNDDQVAHLTYRRPSSSELVITYVEVKPEQRGRGFAKHLVKEMVRVRDEEEAQMEATCGVARGMLVGMGEL